MAITWNTDLSVGVIQIDEEHKVLFDRADELFDAGKSGKTKEMLLPMIEFLENYTKKHFRNEERYMEIIKYPEIEAQKKMHASFEEELDKLRVDFEESGGNIALIISINQLVITWLTNHISKMDKKIGDYAKTLKIKA